MAEKRFSSYRSLLYKEGISPHHHPTSDPVSKHKVGKPGVRGLNMVVVRSDNWESFTCGMFFQVVMA